MSNDTFPAYSFDPGSATRALFKIYTKMFGWFLFSVPDRIHLYGKSLIKFARKAGIEREKIVVISTGIHLEKFKKAKPIDRKEFGLKKSDSVILYAGLMVPRKGIDIMLEVMKRLSKKQKNVKLLLVGGGAGAKKYKRMARELGVDDDVIFAGWRRDLPEIMKMADVLLLPSRGEGLPGVVMEAMAAELPVVASDIPCIPDLIEDGKSGYLCEMDDVGCFVEKINLLIRDKNKRASIGKAGVVKISKVSWALLLKEYTRLYREIKRC